MTFIIDFSNHLIIQYYFERFFYESQLYNKKYFFISILCFFIYCKSKTTDKNIPKQKLETSKKWTESQGKDKEPTFEDLGERRDTLVISSSGDLNNMLSPVYNSATDYTLFIILIYLPLKQILIVRSVFYPE